MLSGCAASKAGTAGVSAGIVTASPALFGQSCETSGPGAGRHPLVEDFARLCMATPGQIGEIERAARRAGFNDASDAELGRNEFEAFAALRALSAGRADATVRVLGRSGAGGYQALVMTHRAGGGTPVTMCRLVVRSRDDTIHCAMHRHISRVPIIDRKAPPARFTQWATDIGGEELTVSLSYDPGARPGIRQGDGTVQVWTEFFGRIGNRPARDRHAVR
jgi:hypothetical protein